MSHTPLPAPPATYAPFCARLEALYGLTIGKVRYMRLCLDAAEQGGLVVLLQFGGHHVRARFDPATCLLVDVLTPPVALPAAPVNRKSRQWTYTNKNGVRRKSHRKRRIRRRKRTDKRRGEG